MKRFLSERSRAKLQEAGKLEQRIVQISVGVSDGKDSHLEIVTFRCAHREYFKSSIGVTFAREKTSRGKLSP